MKNYTKYSTMSQEDERSIDHTQESHLDEMVLDSGEEVSEPEISEYLMGKVYNCNQVYLRENADKNSSPLKILDLGEDVLIEKEEGDWYQVFTSESIEGFVMKDFVEIM